MGYIVFGDPNKIKPQDPRLMGIFMTWLVIFLILIMTKIEIFGIELSVLWGSLLFIAIGLFVLFAVVGVVLYQMKIHYPAFFYKLPGWIKSIV
jgi:hypothetical protein